MVLRAGVRECELGHRCHRLAGWSRAELVTAHPDHCHEHPRGVLLAAGCALSDALTAQGFIYKSCFRSSVQL